MTDAKQLIDRLDREHTLTVDEYEYLITAQTDELAEYAASLADKRRREIYKNEVFVRGLIEIGQSVQKRTAFMRYTPLEQGVRPLPTDKRRDFGLLQDGLRTRIPHICFAGRRGRFRT